MKPLSRLCACVCAATLGTLTLRTPAQMRDSVIFDTATASSVEITAVFNATPPTGAMPLHLKAVNRTKDARPITARVISRSDNSGPSHELETAFSETAPPLGTTEWSRIVPVSSTGSYSVFLDLSVSAGNGEASLTIPGGGLNGYYFTGLSIALAAKSTDDLNDHARGGSSHDPLFAALFDPALLPADWLACSGLDVLAMSGDEYTALPPGVKTALLQWVRLGGDLRLYCKAPVPSFSMLGIPAAEPGAPDTPSALGLGIARTVSWTGAELESSAALDFKENAARPSRLTESADALRAGDAATVKTGTRIESKTLPPLVDSLGVKSFAAWQVAVVLFIFGVLVGPVNLFRLAPAGRRHRLFYTTPIISAGAAVVLLGVIFFQDGVGGEGRRASLVYVDAGESTSFIHQYQVSRTGVLFGNAFTADDTASVSMALMPPSRWARLSRSSGPYSYSEQDAQRYGVQENARTGDWFQSRSEQAHIVDAVRPGRGRIELKSAAAETPPVIVSTFTAPLERVFYVDAAGGLWASPGTVNAGTGTTLQAATEEDFTAWRKQAAGRLPWHLRSKLSKHSLPGFFYAFSSDPRAGTVPTLDSIDWTSDSVFLFGPVRTS